ncbi:MAG: hypothetical protein JWM76_4449 [Pseudonocardiales bacterium]|nr:hypothetical protein [Pseudonocardiales bacterium]
MQYLEIPVALAVVGGAVYRQTLTNTVKRPGRVRTGTAYAVLALIGAGLAAADDGPAPGVLATIVVTAALTGIVGGLIAHVSMEPSGRILSTGTPWSIGVFVAALTATMVAQSPARSVVANSLSETLIFTAVALATLALVIRGRAGVLRNAVGRVEFFV